MGEGSDVESLDWGLGKVGDSDNSIPISQFCAMHLTLFSFFDVTKAKPRYTEKRASSPGNWARPGDYASLALCGLRDVPTMAGPFHTVEVAGGEALALDSERT